MGQLIGLRRLTVRRGLGTIAGRQCAVLRGLGTFLGRSGALICRSGAIVRGTGAIVLRPQAISRRPERLLLACVQPERLVDRMHPRLGVGVSRIGYLIARLRNLVALVRRDLARDRGPQAGARLSVSEMRRMLTMHTANVTNPLI